MQKLKKDVSRDESRRAVNWIQDIFGINILVSRSHSSSECKEDVKKIFEHLFKLRYYENEKLYDHNAEKYKKTIRDYEKIIEKLRKENSTYSNTLKKIKELYKEEHQQLLLLTNKKWWQIWK